MKHGILILLLGLLACHAPEIKKPTLSDFVKKENFATTIDGKNVSLYYLHNSSGLQMAVTNFGGRVVALWVPDRQGHYEDIVLGYDSIQEYINSKEPYFGASIGRYGNRIANGRFTLDGKTYQLAQNNNGQSLHGGPKGFHNVVWDVQQPNESELVLKYVAKDGEEGYPGALSVVMTYTLTEQNEFRIEHQATTDQATVLNLTHHSFFNLHGAGNGTINDHELWIDADRYTPVDSVLIPTGELALLEGTAMDFRTATAIGYRVDANFEQLQKGRGYDHNYVLNRTAGQSLSRVASVYEPKSGRVMEVYTTEPGLQFYGGNFLDGQSIGKGGKPYAFRTAFCLETQHFPDSPNKSQFPSTVLRPGENYHHTCIYKFSTK
jgi:aldose 1-epimerase